LVYWIVSLEVKVKLFVRLGSDIVTVGSSNEGSRDNGDGGGGGNEIRNTSEDRQINRQGLVQ
jgi:hypothetical protein